MPYKNIHWIKLEKRLLNDYRFYSLSSSAQLNYIKFLMLAAETNNKIPKNLGLIKQSLRSDQDESEIESNIQEIKSNFPKFKENKHFYFFREWGVRCNWIKGKELPGNSPGTARELVDKIRIDKIRREYIRLTGLDLKDFKPDDYARTGKAIKTLISKADGNDEKVLGALEWISKQDYHWTLETLIKKWVEAVKGIKDVVKWRPTQEQLNCPNCKGTGWRYDENNKTYKCECRKQ